MSETEKHKTLKELGSLLLRNMGYGRKDIVEEWTLHCNGHNYRVDLYANHLIGHGYTPTPEQEQRGVAIECGSSQPEKFKYIRESGVLLLHLPYGEFANGVIVSDETRKYLEVIADAMSMHRNTLLTSKQELSAAAKQLIEDYALDHTELEKFRKETTSYVAGLRVLYTQLEKDIESIKKFRLGIADFMGHLNEDAVYATDGSQWEKKPTSWREERKAGTDWTTP